MTLPIHAIPAFDKSSVSNSVMSILIATVKNNDVPCTFEAVLNYLLVANGLPQSKWIMFLHPRPSYLIQLTPNIYIPSLPLPHHHHSLIDRQQLRQIITNLNQQQFSRKNTRKPTKENLSELISESKLILKLPQRIEDVIKQFNSLKNYIEVVNLSSAEFD